MKNKITMSDWLEELRKDLPEKVIDQKAATAQELLRPGQPFNTLRDQIRKLVADGKWERVWKYYNGRLTQAYRRKKA